MSGTLIPASLLPDLLPGYHGPRDSLGPLDPPWLGLTRPETRDHVLRVLLAGERCPNWVSDSCAACGTRTGHSPPDHVLLYPPTDPCPACKGTGYLRAPRNVAWARDNLSGGTLSPEDSAAALACDCRRAAVGLPAIRGILGTRNPGSFPPSRLVVIGLAGPTTGNVDLHGWNHDGYFLLGPDEVGLAAGYCLRLQDGTLLCPEPPEPTP